MSGTEDYNSHGGSNIGSDSHTEEARGVRVNPSNLGFVEELYEQFLTDPTSVTQEWQRYFASLDGNGDLPRGWKRRPAFRPSTLFNPPGVERAAGNGAVNGKSATPSPHVSDAGATALESGVVLQDRVDQLVRAYRVRGHMASSIDPLGIPRALPEELEPSYYGLRDEDMKRAVSAVTIAGAGTRTVRGILEHLGNTYCRSVGVEYMHIDDLEARWWLRDRMEGTQNRIALSRESQLRILTRLTDAVIFEEFIQRKFTGAKSFSLEGSESLIPLLDIAIDHAGDQKIDEIVLAMAHRGRLNVLANIMSKSPQQIFREFADADPELHLGGGDVKYHLGHSADWTTSRGYKLHLSLCFNPSHLEFVNPVALGRTRAKQDRHGDANRERGLTILIHGDAAFAGEGVVQETLNLSQLEGYSTGGTLHVIVNNQIGFTTPHASARSSTYATGVAKLLQIPIFHVNGENPEAVAQCIQLAMDYRATFRRDVVVDMYSYRRRGHNEGDEPAFTQPLMVRAILQRPSVRDSYLDHLLKLGEISSREADLITAQRRDRLEKALAEVKDNGYAPPNDDVRGVWAGYTGGPVESADRVVTGVDRERLSDFLDQQTRVPESFTPHPKIRRLLEKRAAMGRGEIDLDWAAAEALALASLVAEGRRIRFSGQDSERGTFSHRHSVLHDVENGETYTPLCHITADQGPFEIINSPLSEAAVLGFDYGYSLDCPEGLVIWEAQFGDFVNAAQVIIDQFITSAEDKWNRLSGMVMLLPHAFEGMGPEHSSARLERFLQLAAEDNVQIASPTTPAQYFHILRRQVLRRWRKPLILMTPKSLLRRKEAVSTLEELETGRFNRVLADERLARPERISRVLLCNGKVAYDLEAERAKRDRDDVAIIRVEELYPLPTDELLEAVMPFSADTPIIWVQEEPENMGAWSYMRMHLPGELYDRFSVSRVCRPESASPATGSASSHRLEQETLMGQAFDQTSDDGTLRASAGSQTKTHETS
jgi:2-oxoglutarate dehydrogenase E1 component